MWMKSLQGKVIIDEFLGPATFNTKPRLVYGWPAAAWGHASSDVALLEAKNWHLVCMIFSLENWLYMYIIIFYEHTLKPKWCMHLFMYMYRYDALIIALLVSFKCNDCIGSCYCFLVIALTDSYSIWVLDSSDHLCQLCGFSSFPALPLPRFQWSQCSSGMYGLFT